MLCFFFFFKWPESNTAGTRWGDYISLLALKQLSVFLEVTREREAWASLLTLLPGWMEEWIDEWTDG